MAVRNRIRRGLNRIHWRGAIGLALMLLVGGLFLWAAQLAWAVGKGKESVMADRPVTFASATPTDEVADVKRLDREVESHPNPQPPNPKSQTDVKRLRSEVESLRAQNEQLMHAIQMLAEEIQWLHGEDQPAANWSRKDAQQADSDKKTSKSNKIHPKFAAVLFELEKELMGEIDAPVIEAELKRRLDEFRSALAESSDESEARPKHKKNEPRAESASPHDSELEKFRQEYENYITERLEYLKAKRKMLLQRGTLSIENATAMDTLIVDLMGRLLTLKEDAASRQEEKNSQSQLDYYPTYPAYPAAIPTVPASPSGKRDPRSPAAAIPATKDSQRGLNAGEFKVKISPQGKTATVFFYDPALDLIIDVETSLRTLPVLLRQLSKWKRATNNPLHVPGGANVPNYADPPPATFEATPFQEDEIQSAPPQPESKAKPTNSANPFFRDPTAGVS